MEEKKKNNSKGLIITLIFLIIVVLGLITYICCDKKIINIKGKENNIETKEETGKQPVKDYPLEDAKKILIRHKFTSETGPIRYLVGTIYEKGYSEDYKGYVAITNISEGNSNFEKTTCEEMIKDPNIKYEKSYGQIFIKDNNGESFGSCDDNEFNKDNGVKLIPYDSVNKEYKELYGKELEKKSYSFNTGRYYYSTKYNAFVSLNCNCGGTFGPYIHIDKIKDAKLDDKTLTIHVYNKVIVPVEDTNSVSRYYLENIEYNTSEKTEESIKQDIITNHLDLINLYEIKFEKQDNNFIFKSLHQVLS